MTSHRGQFTAKNNTQALPLPLPLWRFGVTITAGRTFASRCWPERMVRRLRKLRPESGEGKGTNTCETKPLLGPDTELDTLQIVHVRPTTALWVML